MTLQSRWTPIDSDVESFLARYDDLGHTGVTGAGELFADTFLVLDPVASATLTPAALAAALPARRHMFDDAGVGDLHRTDAAQLVLDTHHVLVRAEWTARRHQSPPLTVASTLLLRREPEGLRIMMYLNHNDLRTLLDPTGRRSS